MNRSVQYVAERNLLFQAAQKQLKMRIFQKFLDMDFKNLVPTQPFQMDTKDLVLKTDQK